MSERLVSVDDLVTIDEIAERLHWSVNATMNIVQGRDGRHKLKFPRPLVGRAKRGVWLWPDVWEWFENVAPKNIEARRRTAYVAAMQPARRGWNHGRKAA